MNIKLQKRENEIAELKERLKEIIKKKRYVGMEIANNNGKMEFWKMDDLYIKKEDKKAKNISFDINHSISISIPPILTEYGDEDTITKGSKQIVYISEGNGIKSVEFANAETLTAHYLVPQLCICLDISKGYVFIEVPEIEKENKSPKHEIIKESNFLIDKEQKILKAVKYQETPKEQLSIESINEFVCVDIPEKEQILFENNTPIIVNPTINHAKNVLEENIYNENAEIKSTRCVSSSEECEEIKPKLIMRTLSTSLIPLSDAKTNYSPRITTEKHEKSEKVSVSCQIDIIKTYKAPILKKVHPFEVVSILQEIMVPEHPPIIEPKSSIKTVHSLVPLKLVTSTGDVVDLPLRSLIHESEDTNILKAGKQIISNEAAVISHNLSLVMNEIQTIEEEPNEVMKEQMRDKLGMKLAIEKDNLISDLKERITELESINNCIINMSNNKEKPKFSLEINSNVVFNGYNSFKVENKIEKNVLEQNFQTDTQQSFFVDGSTNEEETILNQNKKISNLKNSIQKLQNTNDIEQMEEVKNITQKFADNENKNIKESNTVIIRGDVSNNKINCSDIKRDLRETIITAQSISTQAIEAVDIGMSTGEHLFQEVSSILDVFEHKISQKNRTTIEEEAKLVKDIRDAISNSLNALQPKTQDKESVIMLFKEALEQLDEIETVVQNHHNEILLLKGMNDAAPVLTKIIKIRDDLEALIQGKIVQNKLFKNYAEAQDLILLTARKMKTDGFVIASDSIKEVDDLIGSLNRGRPQWFDVKDKIEIIIGKMENGLQKSRNKDLIRNMRDEIVQLKEDNKTLRLEKLEIERNNIAEIAKIRKDYNHYKELYKNAQKYANLIDKTEERPKIEDTKQNEVINKIKLQLMEVQSLEKEHLKEIEKRIVENSSLSKENNVLQEMLKKKDEALSSLFEGTKDSNVEQMLSSAKISDFLRTIEIESNKNIALDEIRRNLTKEVETLNNQIIKLSKNNEDLLKENIGLQGNLINAEGESSKKYAKEIINKDSNSDSAKLSRFFLSKINVVQQSLDKRNKELIDLIGKKAEDRRKIVMLNADLSRLKSDIRFHTIRYNNVKEETDHLIKSITKRDDVIREQKREISRLRALIERLMIMKQISVLSSNESANLVKELSISGAKINYQKTKIRKNNRFDDFLMRERQHYANLEKRRKELRKTIEKQNISILRDVSLLAREQELSIPESIVIQIMPKPKPSQKVETNKSVKEYSKLQKECDDHIKFNQKETKNANKDVKRNMIINARHNKVVVSSSNLQKNRSIPMVMGKPI